MQELLSRIEQQGSIRAATQSMELSYSKALRMIREAEAAVGPPLVETQKGGQARGGAVLTEKGLALLAAYAYIEEKINAYAKEVVAEAFAEF